MGTDPNRRNQLRAALLGLFVHTDEQTSRQASLLPPALRPHGLEECVYLLRNLGGEEQRKGGRIALARVMNTAHQADGSGRHPETERWLALAESFARSLGHDGSLVADIWQDIKGDRTPDPIQSVYEKLNSQRPDNIPSNEAQARYGKPPTSNLDLDTLVTRVRIDEALLASTNNPWLRFEQLAAQFDPRSWSRDSDFWLASTKMRLEGNRFVEDHDAPLLGHSWKGYLFEYVELNWQVASVSGFQVFLNIDYHVDRLNRHIKLVYSLYSAQGGMMLARVAPAGIDVDSGDQQLWFDPTRTHPGTGNRTPAASTPESATGCFVVDTVKNVRFSDLLTRRTPEQGISGSGQILNYMAPAVVGLWMHELLVDRSYTPHSNLATSVEKSLMNGSATRRPSP